MLIRCAMEKIAVVGISCLFPDAETPEAFWRNLLAGKDSRSPATDEKMGVPVRTHYDPRKGKADRFYCMKGGYVLGFEMDPSGFEIPEARIRGLDDAVQWPLHTAREALKESGYWGNPAALAGCGVILGNLSFPTKSSNRLFLPIYHRTVESCLKDLLQDESFGLVPFSSPEDEASENGRISGHPAAVIAEALSLSGPFFSLDAACASSLYAVKLACDYLLAGKADMMLAGAVSAADPFFVSTGFSIFQAYPEEGQESAPLDERSGGLVAGEGAGMFVLKRHSDAVRDGDRIRAVILGIGLSNDGRGQSVLSPNEKGQVLAFERAYADGGIDPKSIQYVECHATGTRLGDKVELNSMDAFFGKHQVSPYSGSVKSNVGHLLTAAGMASMTKAILSMAHGEIPGTINLEAPQSSANQVIAGDRIPASPMPWPGDSAPKRAGVSAFGFGGTNAHLILEETGTEEPQDAPSAPIPPVPGKGNETKDRPALAIVGMDAHFGGCEGLRAFHRTLFDGDQHFVPLPNERWKGIEDQPGLLRSFGFDEGGAPKGAYVDRFDLDFYRFKIPPNENDRLIPQQLLALKVADKALRETDIEAGENVAVIVAMETELETHQMRGRVNLGDLFEKTFSACDTPLSAEQKTELVEIAKDSVHNVASVNQYTSFIGNIMASRIASLWDFSGPAFTLSSEENSVFKALEVARMMLEKREVDAVVLGAVDLAGGVESVLWRNREMRVNTGSPTLSLDRDANGWLVGEGAGAVVLKRLDDAREKNDPIYATIDAVGTARGVSSAAVREACRQAFEGAAVRAEQVGYLEVSASGASREDEEEARGLLEAYGTSDNGFRCAVGSVKANIGHTFAASGMASLIKTALCLHHRFLPETPNWSGPKASVEWEASPFYVPTESRSWFLEEGAPTRIAAVNGLGEDGACAHVILSEVPERREPNNLYLAESSPFLFPLTGDDSGGLHKNLSRLRQEVLESSSLCKTAAHAHERAQERASSKFALSILGRSRDEILQEIDAAGESLDQAFATGQEWGSLRGSYLTLNPIGETGKVAFVYPGGYNSYIGLGRHLFQLFPEMYEAMGRISSRLGEMVGEKVLYPRSLHRASPKDFNVFEEGLLESPVTMFESGIISAVLYTKIMRDGFGLEPKMAIGYSMGEVSMMYALGVWSTTDEMGRTLRDSPLFRTRLAGPMETVREAWGLPEAVNDKEKIWCCYALRTTAKEAREALQGEDRAYLIFVNTPNEVVIAGEDQALKRVIADLGCEHFDVAIGDAIHCEVARAEYDEMTRLHTHPVNPVSGIDFYSADRFAPIPVDAEVIANNIASVYCREVDFPRLVRKAYEDGARVFVEAGPRENCTNWITDILGGERHLAVATNRKGADDKVSLLRALARLYSHRVPLDLGRIYLRQEQGSGSQRSLIKSTEVGGTRIAPAILKAENRKRFKEEGMPVTHPPVVAASSPPGKEVESRDKLERPAGRTAVQRAQGEAARSGRGTAGATETEFTPRVPTEFDRNLSLISSSHAAFLESRSGGLRQIGEMIRLQMSLATRGGLSAPEKDEAPPRVPTHPPPSPDLLEASRTPAVEGTLTLEELLRRYPPREKGSQDRSKPPGEIFDYWDLREFAEGDIGKVFGEQYGVIDNYRRRVRLPLEPYLLVSRVTKLDAETNAFKPCSMTTEYDIPYDAWYAIGGQVPWAVAVESGQCDLWLISYLGIDFECRGDRVYRLLDCTLTFLDEVPEEGDTLRYDIKINSFARTGGTLLFFFSYDCYVKDKRIIEMRGGCAGFFTNEELEAGKGIILTEQEIEEKQKIEKRQFTPLLHCSRSRFERADLVALARGGKSDCFGPAYDQGEVNPALHFTAEPMLMLDRIVSVDPVGGAWGLGMIVAEKDLAPDHWYFPCHFKDDQVLAGSLMADGCGQLMRFYMLYLGLQTFTKDARFQPLPRLAQKVRCRGQVIPGHTLLTYRMEIKEIETGPRPYAIADVDILLGERIVVDFKDLGVVMVERDAQKEPSRLTEDAGEPAKSCPEDRDQGPLFTRYHLEEFATGSIANCFGPEFSFYDNRQPPRTPNGDLQLISRVLETKGTRLEFKQPASVVAEYDVPEDAWFFRENSHPSVTPYSILMEIALQPNGFVSAWAGTTLTAPDVDFCFRNLDGQGTILRPIDLRGKTITNRSELLSTVTTGNTIIQQFRWDLSHGGEPFYEGTAVFGYFLHSALVNQIGLDGGIANDPLQTREYLTDVPVVHIDLKSAAARKQLYASKADRPYEHLAGPQLDFLDEVHIVEQGGKYGLGYLCGYKKIDPADWFYPCHFYQDPVMPGSLGVESILQGLQIFSLHQDLGASLRSPRFCQRLNHRILWKYRGQLIPTDDRMVIEIHIKSVEQEAEGVIVIGDAGLWKNDIRIYEITDAAICLEESGAG